MSWARTVPISRERFIVKRENEEVLSRSLFNMSIDKAPKFHGREALSILERCRISAGPQDDIQTGITINIQQAGAQKARDASWLIIVAVD